MINNTNATEAVILPALKRATESLDFELPDSTIDNFDDYLNRLCGLDTESSKQIFETALMEIQSETAKIDQDLSEENSNLSTELTNIRIGFAPYLSKCGLVAEYGCI